MFYINIQTVLEDSQKVGHDNYTRVYPSLIKLFEQNEELSFDDIVCACHVVYGWMPTMLKFNKFGKDNSELSNLINKIRNTGKADLMELNQIKYFVNNSIVGVSKLLHILRPDIFPIWDSKIYKALFRSKKAYGYNVNNVQSYVTYIDEIKKTIKHPEFKIAHERVNRNLGYDVSAVRACEIILFQSTK
ncbi:MAG: DUF6308 family protein [Alphaproteobacteria bacterium]|nr:DUF6308 family protein [Alphaproteobacteria bacterium]